MGWLDDLFKPSGFDEAKAFNLGNYQKAQGLGWKGIDAMRRGFSRGAPAMQESVGVAKQGAADAQRMIGARGAESYRTIMDLAKQAGSGAGQSAISSGIGGGAATQGRAQALYQAGRTAGQLGESLAGQSASTALAGAAQVSSALQGLASYYASRGQAVGGAMQQHARNLGQYQMQPGSGSIGESLFGLGGMALGGWLGGL